MDDGCLAFADLHYLMALTAARRDASADALVRRMRLDAVRGGPESDAVMRRPGVALAEGLQAFAAGHNSEALWRLRAAHAALPRIGGSHAQRDVFERILIEAAIRAGALEEARDLIGARSGRRGACDGFTASRARVVEDLLAGAPAARNRLA